MHRIPASLRTNCKLFLFDMDDTLADTERLTVSLIERSLREREKVELTEDDREFVFGHGWRDIYSHLIWKYGLSTDPDTIQASVTEMKREHVSKKALARATGIDRVLAIPMKKALVSGSGAEEIRIVLTHLGIERHFEPALSVDHFLVGKPDPAGFRMALEMTGTKPDEAIVFEDSKSGILSGKGAGIFTVFLREFAWADRSAMADAAFENFDEFCDIWERPK